jgi:two-component sensor histidine kinase
MSDNNKQKVRFINGFPDQIFEIDIAIPLGLILNELITNTFKYAKSNSGELYIKLLLNKKDEYLVMNYSDSGQGLPPDFSFEETSSMGLQLVSRLSYQLGGYAEYSLENGSVFNIFFFNNNS